MRDTMTVVVIVGAAVVVIVGSLALHNAHLTQAVTHAEAEAHRGHQSTLAATNQKFTARIAELEARIAELEQFTTTLHAANHQLRIRLSATELERDIGRPGSPIVKWLAHHGPTMVSTLIEEFGAGTPEKLVELQTRREVTTAEIDIDGESVIVYRWIPPTERRHADQIDLWATIQVEDWCFSVTALEEPQEAI